MTDQEYMNLALEEAKKAYALGEVPVGAVIVQDDKIIATGYNRREIDKNALSHAEHTAIDNACKTLGGWRLPRCTLYVTLEPCLMCAGAIVHARIDRVVYGAADPKTGAFGSLTDINALPLNHHPEITPGVCEPECRALLQSFFADLRQKKSNQKTNCK